SGLAKQHLNVPLPQHHRRGIKAAVRCGVGRACQFAIFHDEVDSPLAESDEPLERCRSRAQGRRSEDERVLEFRFGVAEKGHHEALPVAEPAKHRPFAHPCRTSQHVHGYGISTMGRQELTGGSNEAFPIPRGITALRRYTQGRFGAEWDEGHKKHSSPGNTNRTAVRLAWMKAPPPHNRSAATPPPAQSKE